MQLIYADNLDGTRTFLRRVADDFNVEKFAEENIASLRLIGIKGLHVDNIGRAPEEELEILKVSVARVAQIVGVQTDKLPVLDKSDLTSLSVMAKQPRGWNALCATICSEIELRDWEKQQNELNNIGESDLSS